VRELILKVGGRTGQETIVAAHFGSLAQAMLMWRVLNNVSGAGGIDPRSYAVVAECLRHGTEVILCLAVGTDHEAQIAASQVALQRELSVSVRRREMDPKEYAPHVLLVQAAKAEYN